MGSGGEALKVCVYGLWHLGSVTAACLAEAGHHVRGFDPSAEIISGLRKGKPPIAEPGLADLITAGIQQGRLEFFERLQEAVQGCRVVWVTFDTPTDGEDRADTQYVLDRITEILPFLAPRTLVLVSSQLPVGTCRALERATLAAAPQGLSFAYSPENLRLGSALQVFRNPDRVVVGVRRPEDREVIEELIAPITSRVEWTSVESAEMSKHALNAFLAVSISFANEIAALSEKMGADAKEVERALKTESRIGPRAYLSPGAAFAGGTLARDVVFLSQMASDTGLRVPLLGAVKVSNDYHRQWPARKIEEILGKLTGRMISMWGLTYKPGTDTLRRSSSVELCAWLLKRGAVVRAHDPAIRGAPRDLAGVELFTTPEDAAHGSDVLVVMTPWPQYLEVDIASVLVRMNAPNIVDPARFLSRAVGALRDVRYFAVGTPGSYPLD